MTKILCATDYGVDNAGASFIDDAHAVFVAALSAAGASKAYYPAGIYKHSATLGPWPWACGAYGDGNSNIFAPGVGTQFHMCGPGTAMQLGHGDSANNFNPATFADFSVFGFLPTGVDAGDNINAVGVEVLGDVGLTLSDIQFGGFKYQLSLDGCETVSVLRPKFSGGPDTGYRDMITNLGDDSACAIRLGSFKFTVAGSANGNRIVSPLFNNSRVGIFHQDGASNRVENISSEVGLPVWIQSSASLKLDGFTGEGVDLVAGILIRTPGGGAGGGAYALVVANWRPFSTAPVVLIDPASTIHGLHFEAVDCSNMQPGVFPVTGSGGARLTNFGTDQSSTPPPGGVAAGAWTDGRSTLSTALIGTISNDSTQPQAADDVVLLDYTVPLTRRRADTFILSDEWPPAGPYGHQSTEYKQLYSGGSGRVACRDERMRGACTLNIGDPSTVLISWLPVGDGAANAVVRVLARAPSGASFRWTIEVDCQIEGGAVGVIASTVLAWQGDPAIMPADPVVSGGSVLTVSVSAGAWALDYAAGLESLFVGT